MVKLVIWTWTGWTNQETNAHQKRHYKPRKLIGQGVWQCNGRSVSQKGPRKGPAHLVRVATRSAHPPATPMYIVPPIYIHKAFSIKDGSDELTIDLVS